jgi:hypothetical protein
MSTEEAGTKLFGSLDLFAHHRESDDIGMSHVMMIRRLLAVSLITYAGEARRRKKRLLTWRFSIEIYALY